MHSGAPSLPCKRTLQPVRRLAMGLVGGGWLAHFGAASRLHERKARLLESVVAGWRLTCVPLSCRLALLAGEPWANTDRQNENRRLSAAFP